MAVPRLVSLQIHHFQGVILILYVNITLDPRENLLICSISNSKVTRSTPEMGRMI